TYYDWSTRIVYKHNELGTAGFSVPLFFGAMPVPEDPKQRWRLCETFVGAHCAFVNSADEQKRPGWRTRGFVHFNRGISKHSGLDSYDPSVVAPYLERELSWRMQKEDGTVVPLSELPSLEITVSSSTVTMAQGADFPTYGDPQYHRKITSGREGGARDIAA
ncbi:hypothetical protein FA95DRAFT_1487886, partial [Auriscalpium vulgare]